MLKTAKAIILFFLLFFIFIGISLFVGIKIDSFSLGNFSISKFYLKLDKKLILKTQNISINLPTSSGDTSLKGVYNKLSNLNLLLSLFKEIDIKELRVGDSFFALHLDNSFLYLDNRYVNLSSALEVSDDLIKMDIYSIYLKKQRLTLLGNIKIDLDNNVASFLGKYDYQNIVKGDLNAKFGKKYLDFYVDTENSVKSISFLKDFFRIDSVAEEWMYDNVDGDIKLNYLYGKIDLKSYEPVLNSIKGEAVISDAKIRFNPKAKVVDTSKLTVTYQNDELSFDLKEPTYNGNKLYGSRVYIKNLTSMKKGTVYVDLKSDSMLNSDILGILKAYDLKLPLLQQSGTLDSKLLLEIPYLASKKMHETGEFKVRDANLTLGSFAFYTKGADVILKDSDVFIKRSHVKRENMFEGDIALNIDTKNSVASGDIDLDSFLIKSRDEQLLSFGKRKLNLAIDFKKSPIISLDELKTKIEVKDEFTQVKIDDLNLFTKNSNLLRQIGIKNGNLTVDIYDENRIDFKALASGFDLPFVKDGKKIDTLNATGAIRDNSVLIKTDDDDINIVIEKNKNPKLKLKDIDLVLSDDSSLKKTITFPEIDIELRNSQIKLDKEHIFKTSWANLKLKKSLLEFEGEGLDLDLPIEKNGKKVESLEVKGSFANNILKFKSKDKDLSLVYNLPKERIDLNVKGYDVTYNTKDEEIEDNRTSYYIEGINSNIVINKDHVAKADKYNFTFEKNHTIIDLRNGGTIFYYEKDKDKNIILSATNMNDTFLNAILGKKLIKGGTVNLLAKGKGDKVDGDAYFNETKIVDLAILNNLIILINTSPGIINPFLAIPSVVGMATNGGFNLNGYRIIKGKVTFDYDFKSKLLNLSKITTEGNGIDFDGYTKINFDTSKVDAKLKMIFFKDYSKLVNYIPVVNYILLGDQKRVDTEVTIYGTLDDPKYKTNLVKEGVSAPVNFLKRVFMAPVDLIKSTFSGDDEEDKEVDMDKKDIPKEQKIEKKEELKEDNKTK